VERGPLGICFRLVSTRHYLSTLHYLAPISDLSTSNALGTRSMSSDRLLAGRSTAGPKRAAMSALTVPNHWFNRSDR